MSTENQNSLYNKFSRYVGGGQTETADGYLEWWERAELLRDPTDHVYTVENIYQGRLDMIASVFYNEPRWWWVIAQYNNIIDPVSEITPGRVLAIPTRDRLPLLLTTRQGGVESTRAPVTTISPVIS